MALNEMNLLEGKTAFITGATKGIGKAMALAFAKQGAKVFFCGTNPERGQTVAEEIAALTGDSQRGQFYQLDVSKTQDVEEVIKKILDQVPQIDILVNNAGVTRDQLLLRMKEEDWDRVMDINTKSCYNTSRLVLKGMMKARKGKIINISSVVGLTGNPGQVNYASSKAAIIGFTKALAKEVASRSICVNCIAPGFIETDMTDEMTSQQKENLLAQIPFGRMGTPEEIANAAIFLASDLSNYVTGQTLTVDGGMV